MEHRVERPFEELELTVAALADRADDRVAVTRAGLEGRQDQQLEVVLEDVASHTSRFYV
jgi:hypothetical protein